MTPHMNAEDLTLPELSDERIREIENALFTQIARERTARRDTARTRGARRRRIWMGTAGAAAVIAVAAVIAPQALSGIGGASSGSSVAVEPQAPEYGAGDASADSDTSGGGVAAQQDGEAAEAGDREIVATASATVRVQDSAAAAQRIAEAATQAGGYVESMSVGGARLPSAQDPVVGREAEGADGVSAPAYQDAWITVRIPAERLTDSISALSKVGDVTASEVQQRDVTTEAVDLRARVEALTASVDRLTELVSKASSTADLISAEDALAERQAERDSLRQQLTVLETQVRLSSLTVTLTTPEPAVEADPAGFGDGFAAGWNGLVAMLNGIVVTLGFLLPWLVVLAVVVLIVWVARRARRRRAP